jgi:hypothetical protein
MDQLNAIKEWNILPKIEHGKQREFFESSILLTAEQMEKIKDLCILEKFNRHGDLLKALSALSAEKLDLIKGCLSLDPQSLILDFLSVLSTLREAQINAMKNWGILNDQSMANNNFLKELRRFTPEEIIKFQQSKIFDGLSNFDRYWLLKTEWKLTCDDIIAANSSSVIPTLFQNGGF